MILLAALPQYTARWVQTQSWNGVLPTAIVPDSSTPFVSTK